MQLDVLWYTDEPEKKIGVAMRRCYTTYPIETIQEEVSREYGEYLVAAAYERYEFDVYEHVRMLCVAKASEREMLDTILNHRYVEATALDQKWLLSLNLRTALEAARAGEEAFSHAVHEVCPRVARMVEGGKKPDRPSRREVAPQEFPPSPRVSVLQSLTPRMIAGFLSEQGYPRPAVEELAQHCFFTFEAEGISRVATHQLVRHRPAAYSQESQRFSAAVHEEFILPDTIRENSEALAVATSALNSARGAYERLRGLGIRKEDARFMLPLGTGTKLMMTITARYLRHITFFRSSSSPIGEKAQWEIRAIADQMLSKARELMPEIDWTPKEAL